MEKRLPTYKIIVNPDDNETGVYGISLVDSPAIEVDWIKLSKELEDIFFSAQKDKQMLFGPLLIPDKLILRKAQNGDLYNIVFDKDTIQTIADKYNETGDNKTFNFQHSDRVVDAVLLQNWITGNIDKSQDYGYALPEGTWFGGVKVKDESFWMTEVKSEKVKGFSIEIKAETELIKMTTQLGGPGSGRKSEGNGEEPTSSLIPSGGGIVTDPEVISKILTENAGVKETPFDKTPNDKIDGAPARIISSQEMEDRIKTAMNTPTEIYNSGNTSDTPDALEFPDRKTAEKIAVMETFGTWSETPETFINGEEMVKKGGVWYGSEKGKGKLFNKTAIADKNKKTKLMGIKTNEGVALYYDGEVAVGTAIFTDEAMTVVAPEGAHMLEDGRVITLDNAGVILSIAEETPEIEVEAEVVAGPSNEELAASFEELRTVIADISSRLDALENVEPTTEEEATLSKVKELEEKLTAISEKAGAPSIKVKSDLEIKKEENETYILNRLSSLKKW
jgi:hypothetical protein